VSAELVSQLVESFYEKLIAEAEHTSAVGSRYRATASEDVTGH
jgi:hypothetical protein